MRELIRFDNRWQAEPLSENRARVFVPGPWAGHRVVLTPGPGAEWSAAHVAGEAAVPDTDAEGWVAGEALRPGTWNQVEASGSLDGGRMVASTGLYIRTLEADRASDRSIAVHIRLSLEGTVSLFFSLTTPDGRCVGAQEVQVSRRARALTVELHTDETLQGPYQLKAVLTAGERILDNARVDVRL